MTARTLFIVLLCVFLFLYGLGAVTNFRFEWMGTITGFAALLAGVVGFVSVFTNRPIT